MEYCKLQIGCMIIVLYVACIYIREKQIYQMKRKNVLFETILAAGIVGIFFDGATAYTVNHLAEIPASVNTFLHLCFLSFLDIFYVPHQSYNESLLDGVHNHPQEHYP